MPAKKKSMSLRQRRFLLSEEANAWADARNSSAFSIRISGKIEIEIFKWAFDQLVSEVDNLRARIIQGTTFPEIEISQTASDKLAFLELEEDALDAFLAEEVARPIDARQHSFRSTLVKLANDQWAWLLVMHHMFTDQIGLQLLFDRMEEIYRSKISGEELQAPPWADQAPLTALPENDPAWREALASMTPSAPIYDVKTQNAGSRRVHLALCSDDWTSLLERASRACDVRRSARLELAALLSVQVLYLKQATGQSRHVIGIPVHGRKSKAARHAPELRMEILPLELEIEGKNSFDTLVSYVRDEMNEMLKRPPISLGNRDLFSSQVNLSQMVYRDFAGLSADIHWPYQNCADPSVLFTLQGLDTGKTGALELIIDANIIAFPEGEIGQWRFKQIENLFVQLANGKELNELDILCEDEKRAVLDLSRAKTKYKTESTIVQHILQTARRTPSAVALSDGKIELSYGALCYKIEQGRQFLLKLGVTQNDCVMMALPRSLDAVVSMLSIMACGAAYVPIDPSYPASRVGHMAKDCGATLLLCSQDRIDELKFDGVNTSLWGVSSLSQAVPLNVLEKQWASDGSLRAYIIYTSGSTGVPKGVQISHRHVMRLMVGMQPNFKFTNEDVFSVFHSLAFDFSVFELWGALLNGAKAVLVPQNLVRSAEAVRDFIASNGVTVFSQTPSAFYQFDRVDRNALKAVDLSLRLIVFGGEALDQRKLKNWFERYGDQKPQLVNMYGITETTVHVTQKWLKASDVETGGSNIGTPLPDLSIYLLDENQRPVPSGAPGEIYVAGDGVAIGYLNRPELNAERFLDDPFKSGRPMYRSGDFARLLADGSFEYLGRGDAQVQLRGFRIELGEIEAKLLSNELISEARVLVREDDKGTQKLIAYLVGTITDLRTFAAQKLPKYMVPAEYVWLDNLPLTSNGKLDIKRLPLANFGDHQEKIDQKSAEVPTHEAIERRLQIAWKKVLGRDDFGRNQGFFECGGQSVQIYDLQAAIAEQGLGHVEVLSLLEHVSISAQADYLANKLPANALLDELPAKTAKSANKKEIGQQAESAPCEIAVIGMSGRFPDAENVAAFWQNLLDGKSAIRPIEFDELDVLVDRAEAAQPNYVASRAVLENIECFDEKFFGMTPREAQFTDPQHRAYLELVWHALEDSGTDPSRADYQIGIWGSVGYNRYWDQNVSAHREKLEAFGHLTAQLGNEKDFAPMRAASKFGLQGPAFNINTACSSSLVAIANAVHGLRAGLCRMAIAGGVSIPLPMKAGYLYQSGGIGSADGVCRPFDKGANGTVFGGGGAFVALKKLEDARADGDQIHAIIRGCGMNNDGARKLSFAAPSVQGQAEAISLAHNMAGVIASDIGFVETHGTATPLGDPIEIEGLTKAFRQTTREKQFCRIGAVKANIGHMDSAAGISGFIKAVHVVREGKVPPLLHYQEPNPNIDIENTPFRPNSETEKWESNKPRIAGVSSFGLGGTNVHTVVSQAEPEQSEKANRDTQIVLLSAKTNAALDRQTSCYVAHFDKGDLINFADAAWTSQIGRQAFKYRKFAIASSSKELSVHLKQASKTHVFEAEASDEPPKIVFMFPGQGSQYLGMGAHLYQSDALVRSIIDQAADHLLPKLGLDLRAFLTAHETDADASEKLRNTRFTQPAIYALSYALARYMQNLGIHADYMVGHSIGEFVAATLAGVFSFEAGLDIIAERARLMADLPSGGMLSVRAPAAHIKTQLPTNLDIAAINSPSLCVIAGPQDALDAFAEKLAKDDIASSQLHTSHAFHSAMMDPMVDALATFIEKLKLRAPRSNIVSSVTNQILSKEDATSARYWAEHARACVHFAGAIDKLSGLLSQNAVLVELGPRATLCTLARQCGLQGEAGFAAVLGSAGNPKAEAEALMQTVGELWLAGANINWAKLHGGKRRIKAPLPLYSFEKNKHWLEALPHNGKQVQAHKAEINAANTAPVPAICIEQDLTSESERIMSHRLEKIIGSISKSIEDMSGIVIGSDELELSFTDMGLDSLLLSQLGLFLKKEYDQEISLKSLMGELSSVADLSGFLNEVVPADAIEVDLPAPQTPVAHAVPPAQIVQAAAVQHVATLPAPTAPSGPSAAPSDASAVERVISDQLGVMLKQLQAISGTPSLFEPVTPLNSASAAASPMDQPLKQEVAPAPLQPQLPEVANISNKPEPSKQNSSGDQKPLAMARIDKTNRSGELSASHHEFLDGFIADYCARTSGSKAKGQEARSVLADARSVAGFSPLTKELTYSIVVDYAKGAELTDIDGNKYLDFTAGFGSNIFGHQPDFIQEALKAQLDKGMEIGPQHPLAIETAKLICELTGMDRVAFATTGSEAVTGALRAARTVTARDKLMTFNGSYHGIFDEVIIRATPSGQPMSVAPGIVQSACQNVVLGEYCTDAALELLEKEAPNLAAILLEPVQSAALDMKPKEFLHKVRQITQKHGVAMILDEVVTGFRSHPGGAQSYFGVEADIATYGKVMGGGLAISAIAGRGKWMDAFDGGAWQFGDESRPEAIVTFLAGTLVRHPLALASAHAALSHIKRVGPSLQEGLNSKTAALAAELTAFAQSKGVDVSASSFSSVFRVNLPVDQPLSRLFYPMMRHAGIFVLEDRNFFVTTAHSEEDLDAFGRAFRDVISSLVQNGFLKSNRVEASSDTFFQLEEV